MIKIGDGDDSHLSERLLKLKSERLNLTSTKNGKNIEYIREIIHIPIPLRLWIEMQCQCLLDPMFILLLLLVLYKLSFKWYHSSGLTRWESGNRIVVWIKTNNMSDSHF